jgi:dCTP deaminase
MPLSGQTIRARGIITPFHERTVFEGMSFGVGPAGYDIRLDGDYYVPSKGFVIASSIEHFNMPVDVLATVHNKSTLIRMGIDAAHDTVIEPGWRGVLTLEIENKGPHPLQLEHGMPIAQILFWLTDEPCEQVYSGKYQDQEAGPQGARFEGMVIK